MSTESQIQVAIKEIKELEFMMNEEVEIGAAFDFNYHVSLHNDIANEHVIFTITANYMITKTTEVFMRGKSKTTFLIKDMHKHARKSADGSDDGVDLPDQIWVTLFSIAFTHGRALLAKSSAGTKFSHMLMPIINPDQEFKKIFGHELNKGKY